MVAIRLGEFEGTLDVLVALVERGEVDIAPLALADVARQCLDLLRGDPAPDPAPLADALAWSARLLYLKSAALLPAPPAPARPSPDEEADPVMLAAMLDEYRRFKAVADALRAREAQGLRSFPRLAPPPPVAPPPGLSNVTLDRLVAIVQQALHRQPPDPPGQAPRETVTVRERLAALEAELRRDGRVSFSRFIAGSRGRIEVVVGFMAVLELIKRGLAAAIQPEPFGDIVIVSVEALAPPTPMLAAPPPPLSGEGAGG